MSSKDTLILQYERLFRHYITVVNTYDPVSLLDLAHSLRIWTELKDQINSNDFPNINKPLFISSSPSRKIISTIKKTEYIWCGFGKEPVITYASSGDVLYCPYKKNSTIGLRFKRNEKNGIEISSVHFIRKQIEEDDIKSELFLKQNFSNTKYSNWLNTEAIRLFSEKDNKLVSISRELLIKRVANAFEASHPMKDDIQDQSNQFDQYISYLFNFTCGGLPIPYYVTLKIAQDIIKIMPKILQIEEKII